MSHDVTGPKGPAPIAEVNSVRKPMKYLGTLLSTETEEVSNGDQEARDDGPSVGAKVVRG
jgi:hypothetical protein